MDRIKTTRGSNQLVCMDTLIFWIVVETVNLTGEAPIGVIADPVLHSMEIRL